MQVRGDLGALLLLHALAGEAHEEGGEDHAEHDGDDDRAGGDVARRAERAGDLEEDERRGDDERDPGAGAADVGQADRARRLGGLARATAGRRRLTCDWRHSSAPPAATSTSGHAIASENQRPSARIASSALRTSRPVPSPTSSAARPVRIRRTGAAESSSGSSAQPSA